MRTYTQLNNQPVFSHDGEKIGMICDLCIQGDGRVTDVIIQENGLFGKKFKVPLKELHFQNNDSVIMSKAHPLIPYRDVEEEHYTMNHCNPLLKRKSFTQDGEMLGLLDDVYFMEEVGTIVGYELTDGFFSDISHGKKVIRPSHPPKIENEAIILSAKKLRGEGAHDEVSKLSK